MQYYEIPGYAKYAISKDGVVIDTDTGANIDYCGLHNDPKCYGRVPYVELNNNAVSIPTLLAYVKFGILPFNIWTPKDVMDIRKVTYDVNFSQVDIDPANEIDGHVAFYTIPGFDDLAITRTGVVLRKRYANARPIASRDYVGGQALIRFKSSDALRLYVSRMVYLTFNGPLDASAWVVHKNSIRTDFSPNNLLQIPRAEYNEYKIRRKRT